jgi:sigma-B regulation protein RsbU (phosphoserine phosphatase)
LNSILPAKIAAPRTIDRPLSVLIADDDELMSALVALKVEALGCAVETVGDGAAAAELLLRRSFDVLVTDWNMPGMDGMALVRLLRGREAQDAYLYIIMMTADPSAEGVRAGLQAGVDDFVRKPVNDIELELGIASARRIVDLQRRLARRTRHMAAAHRRTRVAYRQIKDDLEAAAATQQRLLPEPRSFGTLRTAGLFLPSSDIGGDIYNVVARDGGLLFFHLDVAGHGVPAALRSFALHNQLSNAAPGEALADFTAQLNDRAADDDGGYFTMIYGIADAASGRCRFVRAGHPYAMHLVHEDCRVSAIEEGGLPVGLLSPAEFPETQMTLAPGDRLFVYSDGVTDCVSGDGEPFGDDRLMDAIRRTATLSLGSAVDAIRNELRSFCASSRFGDDVSLLVIERAVESEREKEER